MIVSIFDSFPVTYPRHSWSTKYDRETLWHEIRLPGAASHFRVTGHMPK
jgi:hypothetical protein